MKHTHYLKQEVSGLISAGHLIDCKRCCDKEYFCQENQQNSLKLLSNKNKHKILLLRKF